VPPPGTLGIGGKAAFLAACTAASAFGAEVNTRGAADAPVARASIAPIVSGGREATQGRGGGPPRPWFPLPATKFWTDTFAAALSGGVK
jgi:hypothetical protein